MMSTRSPPQGSGALNANPQLLRTCLHSRQTFTHGWVSSDIFGPNVPKHLTTPTAASSTASAPTPNGIFYDGPSATVVHRHFHYPCQNLCGDDDNDHISRFRYRSKRSQRRANTQHPPLSSKPPVMQIGS
nr:unnamed protein product [Spirometra erinaceieuropaei]